jgi:hypothetical protein
VTGPVALSTSTVSVGLSCASTTASCTGSVTLSAILSGTTYSLGAQQVTLARSQKATISIPIPSATRTKLRSYAGQTISINVTFTTTSSDGTQHPVTTTFKATVPR